MSKNIEPIAIIDGIHGKNLVFSKDGNHWVLSDYNIFYWGTGTEKLQSINFPVNAYGKGVFLPEGLTYVFPAGKLVLENDKVEIERFSQSHTLSASPEQNYELSLYHVLPSGLQSLVSYNFRPPLHGNETVDAEKEHRLFLLDHTTNAKKQGLLTKNAIEKTSAIYASESFLFAGNQQLHVWDKIGRKVEAQFEMNYRSKIIQILFLPDENMVLACRADGTLEGYDLSTLRMMYSEKLLNETPAWMAKNPRSNRVLIGGERGEVVEISVDKGVITPHNAFNLQARLKTGAFHPEGKLLYVSSTDKLMIFSWE